MKTYIDSSRFPGKAGTGTVPRQSRDRHGSRSSRQIGRCKPAILFTACCLLFLFLPLALFADDLKPTPFFMDFYGAIEGAKAGDEITVFNGKGILCGRLVVTKGGEYGFLHVYGNDPTTDVDEGAALNEALTFKLNGTPLQSQQNPVLWLGDGQRQRVDFRR